MTLELTEHFSFKKLLKFVYPSIFMMVFTSVYGVVDGIFVSNFSGEDSFTAVNFIMPIVMAYAAFGFMLGTGGSALVSKILGEGDKKRANSVFSLIVYVTVVLGAALTAVSILTLRPLAYLLDVEHKMSEELIDMSVLYGTICLGGCTLFMLQNLFQSFFPVVQKHKLGLMFIVAAGLTNAALDAVFIAGLKMGLVGAALATVIGQAVGGLAPLLYFIIKRNGILALGKTKIEIKAILKACANGSSEMMTQISLSVVNILYNFQLLRLVGPDGVASYGVLMYVSFIFCSVFIGYSIGAAPIIGYNFGAKNSAELKNVLIKSTVIIAVLSALMFALAISLSYPLSYIFVGSNRALLNMTARAFRIFSFIFLILGFNIFASAFFTALNNGLVSAVLSFLRTFVFQVLCVFVLPIIFGGVDGVWAANIVAETLSVTVTVAFLLGLKKKYGY